MKQKKEFDSESIFSYDSRKKKLFGISVITIAIIILASILVYIFALKNSNFAFVKIINSVIGHVVAQIKNATLIGALYSSMFGGLFFVVISMEAVFISFLRADYNPFLLMAVFIAGIIIAFSINYYIGLKLNTLSKKIIPPKKFYKIKGMLNKYGAWTILLFNATPLPAQPLAAILGVFRYNKTRFYIFFITGQVIKYSAIIFAYIYIFK